MATRDDAGADGVTHHMRHRWEDETALSDRIVTAVAGYEGTDEASLPPIEDSINPDALENLFVPRPGADPTPGCVTFSYYGYTVVVQSTGRILLRTD